jgi:hypothetical protein
MTASGGERFVAVSLATIASVDAVVRLLLGP